MASCENCLHYEVCKPMGLAMLNAMKAGSLTEGVEHNCYIKCFKPIADVEEVKHEKWIACKNNSGYKCSNCGARIKNSDFFNGNHIWCHKCGAKMDEGEAE